MRKLKIEIDADLLSIPMTTIGDLFGYLSGVTAHLSDHGAPLAMHQPATPITDAYGHHVGSWLVIDGPHTTGEEPGNGIERAARAKQRIHIVRPSERTDYICGVYSTQELAEANRHKADDDEIVSYVLDAGTRIPE